MKTLYALVLGVVVAATAAPSGAQTAPAPALAVIDSCARSMVAGGDPTGGGGCSAAGALNEGAPFGLLVLAILLLSRRYYLLSRPARLARSGIIETQARLAKIEAGLDRFARKLVPTGSSNASEVSTARELGAGCNNR